ncbi:MAG: hypothetical protein M3407_03075 [Acidobacteriota bacterium]|jgi:hypothetical protein|nr:hypothetical protein [Acidobacteriota bacterium]
MANKVTVKRVGVLSLAKIQGLLMAVIGLIFGVFYGLFIMIFGAALMSASAGRDGGGAAMAGGIVGGLMAMILIPIFYGVLGFVFGAISALIYNAAAGVIGGLEMEIENKSDGYATPPPPPNQWAAGDQYQSPSQPY